jgi:hypothetical protein
MTHKIAIGTNTTGFKISDNTIQTRFAARAVVKAETQGWKLVGETETLLKDGIRARHIEIENNDGEKRHVLGYNIQATANQPFVLFVNNGGKAEWSRRGTNSIVIMPKALADDKFHMMFTITHVDEKGNRQVSTQCYDRRYMRLIAKQADVKITPENDRYLNPIDIVPSLAIVAMLLSGVKVSINTKRIKETRETFALFQRDEELALQGVSYQDRIKELAPVTS